MTFQGSSLGFRLASGFMPASLRCVAQSADWVTSCVNDDRRKIARELWPIRTSAEILSIPWMGSAMAPSEGSSHEALRNARYGFTREWNSSGI